MHRENQLLVLEDSVFHVLKGLGEHGPVVVECRVAVEDAFLVDCHVKLKLRLLSSWSAEDLLELLHVTVDSLNKHISDHS